MNFEEGTGALIQWVTSSLEKAAPTSAQVSDTLLLRYIAANGTGKGAEASPGYQLLTIQRDHQGVISGSWIQPEPALAVVHIQK